MALNLDTIGSHLAFELKPFELAFELGVNIHLFDMNRICSSNPV